jgi:UDP:flavonoid glycosyltransferase YjiC (YdhE family)
MRILFASLRNTSHFLPLVPFIEACRGGGHEVAVAAPPDLAERVAQTGAAFFPFGHPGDQGLQPIWARMRDASENTQRIAIGELFAGVCASTALPGLLETVRRWQPSVVVRESQEYASIVAAESVAIPHVRVAITLRSAEAQIWPLAAAPLDALGRGAGLPPDPSSERVLREPVLTSFPASLEAAEHRSQLVRRFLSERKRAAPLPDHWPGRSGPLVYATFGTVTGGMEPMQSAYRTALDAVAELPVRVLLTIGADLPLAALGNVPANVHVERFVPQDEVLPHAAAVLCHGGSGTVLGALAAGVPLVVAPLFADQPNNAERVAAVGAGLAFPQRAASAATMREALTSVIERESFRAAAGKLAAEMAELPEIAGAARELEALARGPG